MDDSKKINAILKEIYQYEKFMKTPPQNTEYKGYLIEKNLMETFKKMIFYEELKNQISDNLDFANTKLLSFDKMKENKEKINFIIQTKFKNGKELKNALDDNQKFSIITDSLWWKICKPENRNEDGIKFIIKDNKIMINFNNNEKMTFDINNGVIEKNTLMNSTIKIKNEKIDIESKDKKPINKEDLINEIQLNSYSCTKCKSEIELESITFNDEKTEDSITYICKEKCGKITENISE